MTDKQNIAMRIEEQSCYNCIAYAVCRYTPAGSRNLTRQPPFISDDHIAPFLKEVARIYAQACDYYREEIKP